MLSSYHKYGQFFKRITDKAFGTLRKYKALLRMNKIVPYILLTKSFR